MYMNRFNYWLILLFPLAWGIASCGKAFDENFNVKDPDSYARIYTIQAIDDSAKHVYKLPMTLDTTVYIYANYGGLGAPANDIRVTFGIRSDLVAEYNAASGTGYPMMLDGSYSVSNETVTIGRGKLISDPVKVSIRMSALDGIGTFVLPVRIESLDADIAVNENLRTAYLLVSGYYTANPFTPYDRTEWEIAGCSSEEPGEGGGGGGGAVDAIDGNGQTYWCTAWRKTKPGPPHWIAVDMGRENEIHGFLLRGRQDSANPDQPKSSGNPRVLTVQTSDNGTDWSEAGSFELPNTLENTLYLDHLKKARYFRLTVTATHADFYQTTLSEIQAF